MRLSVHNKFMVEFHISYHYHVYALVGRLFNKSELVGSLHIPESGTVLSSHCHLQKAYSEWKEFKLPTCDWLQKGLIYSHMESSPVW